MNEPSVRLAGRGQVDAREALWDWVKGGAILAVVLIHCLDTVGLSPFEVEIVIVLRQFVNFAVPIFLATAGYLQGRSRNIALVQRLRRILVPYLVWTAIYIVLFHREHLVQPDKLLSDVLLGNGISIGYFVIVLTQMTLLTPLLVRIPSFKWHLTIAAILSLIGFSVTYLALIPYGFPANGVIFIVWYPCYHVGFMMARFPEMNPSRKHLPVLLAAIGIALLAAIFEGLWWFREQDVSFAVSQLKFTSVTVSVLLFLFLFTIRNSWAVDDGMVTWLGRNSYFIYLFHLIPLLVSQRLLRMAGVDHFLLQIAFKFIFAAGVSLVAIWVARKIVPARFQAPLLG